MKPLRELMPPEADYDYKVTCPAHPRHWTQDTQVSGDWEDTSDFCDCCTGECEDYKCGHPVGYYAE
jgi:hypothetical protein